MAFPLPDTGDPDLDALDAFLISDRAPEDCLQLSELDGLLTAVAIGPELIMPSEWLPAIWGGGEPEFESMAEAQRIIGTITGRYNEILRQIRREPEAFAPIFWAAPDGATLAADWAEGFMDGVRLRPAAWRPLLDAEEAGRLLVPILAFLHDEEGRPLLAGDADELAETRRAATDLIAPSIVAIDRFWRARERTPRSAAKVGRNEPCPCGSGRKHKRCCGAN